MSQRRHRPNSKPNANGVFDHCRNQTNVQILTACRAAYTCITARSLKEVVGLASQLLQIARNVVRYGIDRGIPTVLRHGAASMSHRVCLSRSQLLRLGRHVYLTVFQTDIYHNKWCNYNHNRHNPSRKNTNYQMGKNKVLTGFRFTVHGSCEGEILPSDESSQVGAYARSCGTMLSSKKICFTHNLHMWDVDPVHFSRIYHFQPPLGVLSRLL